MDRINAFSDRLWGKQVWLIGIAVTNTPTIRWLAERGVAVTACDRRSREQVGEEVCAGLEKMGVALHLGEGYLDGLDRADVLFRTPGMYYNLPVLQDYRQQGGVLTGEMEVFCDLCPCPLIAVTGSDGKTTTSTLIAEILRAQGKTVHLGGNIGRALLPEIERIRPDHVAVVELSSFQLISMRPAPQVSVVTNVTPNHLDVHGTMEEYVETKRQVFAHQNAFSRTVLGADCAITAGFAGEIRGDCLQFSMEKPVFNGAFYQPSDGGIYAVRHGGAPEKLMNAPDIRLPGMHNVANYLAAICATRDLAERDSVRRVAREFAGVEHRIEFVRELDGVRWYNDSIATSPTRAMAGLRAFDRKIILLAGGYDKKIPFQPMAPEIVQRVKELILCGDTAGQIEAVVRGDPGYREGHPEIHRVADIEAAVALAHHRAEPGDIVSLSPACASFDRYPNFEVRGRHFKELVQELEPNGQG